MDFMTPEGGAGLGVLYLLRAMGMTVLAGLFLCAFLDARMDGRRARLIMGAGIGAVILANIPLAFLLGSEAYMRLTPVLLNLPVFVLFGWVSRYRDGRLLFTLTTLMAETGLVTLAGMLCALPFGGRLGIDLLGRCAAALLLLWLNWRLRPLYLEMQGMLRRGWLLFSLIPLAYYVSLYVYIMLVDPGERAENLTAILVTSGMAAAAHTVIFFFFQTIRRQEQTERERQLLSTQVSALRRQQEMMARSEEKLRVHRHDMRFVLHTLTAMLERGDTAGALEYLGQSDKKLNDTVMAHYCESPVLDALLAYYAEQARSREIQVRIEIKLSRKLPADEDELCAVLANALENAIHACEALPAGTPRRIEVAAASKPHFCVEIANTCDGKAEFDRNGFPISREPGHGVGTRSIAAFFDKYQAVYSYSVGKDGMFRLRFLIARPDAGTR